MKAVKGCLHSIFATFVMVVMTCFAQAAHAQSGPAFGCTGDIYQVQSGQLRIFDPVTSTYQNVGTNQGSYNATGFNIQDNFAYASQSNWLIRIYADGTTERLYNLGFGSYSGDVDYSNNYYLRRNGTSFYKIDLATGNFTIVSFTGVNASPADIAYIDSSNALVGFRGSDMIRYNIGSNTKEIVSVPGLTGSGAFGATWTDLNGRLFTFNNNSGLLFEIFDYTTNSPTASIVGQGDPSNNNDGFSCSLAPFPNLSPVAFDDEFTTPVNVAITENFIDDNGNGMDNDPEGTTLTATTTPLGGPSNGTVVINPDGSFTYTPDPNFIGVDTFDYEVSDATGLTATATVTITIEGDIEFTADKSVVGGPNPVTAAGQVVQYQVVLTNTGDIPLTDVEAEDTAPDGSTVILSNPTESITTNGALDIGETWTYLYDYTVTQDDIDAGGPLVNAVTATTDETGPTEETDTTSTPIAQSPLFTLDKIVDVTSLTEPGLLTYTITVVNTGNLTLTNPVLSDDLEQDGGALALTSAPTLLAGGDADGDGDLDVGETWNYEATFDATQAEIDNLQDIINTAEFTTNEAGPLTDDATTTINALASFTVVKTNDTATLTGPDTISYTIVIENTGDLTLTDVVVTDTLTQGANGLTLTTGPALAGDLDNDGQIDVDETWTYTSTYNVTQDNIDDGNPISNLVVVETSQLPDDSDSTSTAITQSPSFDISKTADPLVLSAPGQIRYEIAVENTGNTSLQVASFTDTVTQDGSAITPAPSAPVLQGDTDGDGELDVGESWIYVVTLNVEQSAIDNGQPILNTATFTPVGIPAQSANASTTITQTDALELAKSVAAGEPTSFDAIGDTIDFTFVVSNTGNTTRPGPITISDNQIPGPLECQPGDLAPMTSVSCTFTWVAEQEDLDAGFATNTATASDNDGFSTASQTATVTAVQAPEITILKERIVPMPEQDFQPGVVLQYDFTIANTGNVTLMDPIDVSDSLITNLVCNPVPGTGLEPSLQDRAAVLNGSATLNASNSYTCTGSYTVTQSDLEVGSVVNVATVEAVFGGGAVEHQNDAIFPADAEPKLVLDKGTNPDPATFLAAGDTILYTYAVTNEDPPEGSSVGIIEPITITDDKFSGPQLCYDPQAPGNSTVLVGQTVTCSFPYTVTQADVDAESVTNTATANTTYAVGDGSIATIISAPDSVTVTSDITPAITLNKVVDAGTATGTEVGDSIPFTMTATNTGDQTLNNVTITDPQLGALTCLPAAAPVTLAPNAELICSGSYIVTLDDIDNQTVGDTGTAVFTNTATVNATDPSGAPLDPVDASATHEIEPAAPELTIVKALVPDPAGLPAFENVGDVLTYRMTVTNSGNMTVDSINVTDSLVTATTCAVGTLEPGDSDQSCLFQYTVTQEDIDAGEVENTGTATGQPADPTADPVEATDTITSAGPDALPELTVVKAGSLDLGADGVATVGDLITYTFTVTNTGNVTIIDTSVSDPDAAPLSYDPLDDTDFDLDIDTLAPGDSAIVTATYPLDQGDIDLGTVTNSAQATGADPDGDPVVDASDSTDPNDGAGPDDPTITEIPRGPAMTLDKSVSAAVEVTEGTELTYSYEVENTGNVTLTNVTITDLHTSSTGTAPLVLSPNNGVVATLDAGESVTFTATYTVTQDDIDSGVDLTNTATASSQSPAGTTPPTATDDETVDLADRVSAMTVDKSVSESVDVTVGTELTYTYIVTNTGNVTLTDATLVDQHTSSTGTAPLALSPNSGVVATLEPGDDATFTATYTVTQDDIDAGTALTNTVTADADSPAGTTPPSDTDTETVDLDDVTPQLEALKTIQSQTGSTAGDTVIFDIVVANTGNVTLTDVVLTDTLRRADGTLITPVPAVVWDSVDDDTLDALDVGEDWVYTLTYTLTQADIDAGGITNSVRADAEAPSGAPVFDISDNGTGDGDDPTSVIIAPTPSLQTLKTITSTTTEVGQTVRFSITIENTGNVTLTGVAIASDDLTRNDTAQTPLTLTGPSFADATLSSPAGTLQVGEIATYNASYVLTQDDIDAGGITNTATATGTPPFGDPVTDVSDDDGTGTDDPTVLTIAPLPEFLLDKRLAAGSGPSFDEDGQILDFEFEITNIGNVTLFAPFDISDPLITDAGGTIICPAGPILPDGSIICEGSYEVTQEDVDNGGITNVATATVGDADPVTDSVPVPAVQNPSLDLVKSAPSIDPIDFITGLVVRYTFTATNTGNTTLTTPITIDDALFAPSDYTCDPWPTNGLAPDGVYVCTADYTITNVDVFLAVVSNNATGSSGPLESPIANEIIPNDGVPALSLTKTIVQSLQPDNTDSGTLTFDEVGDQLVYEFLIENVGEVAFAADITVTDTLFANPISCYVPTPADPNFSGGETQTCQATYVVTQDDVDAGEVLNEAFARTEFGAIPTIVLSGPDDVTVTANETPGVTIDKVVDSLTYAAVGDVLSYDITVTNTGNQTLTNIDVQDPLLPALSCGVATLAVGDDLICSGSYTVDQDDIDAGSVVNVATATGLDPDGDAIAPQDATATSDGPVQTPTLALNKIALPSPFGDVGSDLTYVFEVTNTSIYTLSDVTITDILPAPVGTYTCDVGTLAPGESSSDCTVTVVITQDDIDAGSITNTATADALAPGDVPVTIDDTVVVDGPVQDPSLELTKTASVPATVLGATVTYTFSVENTGNVTLADLEVSDDLTRNDGETLELTTPVTLVTSGGVATGDLDGDGAFDPAEIWTFTATYEITQDDINAGGFSNTATAFGDPPGPGIVFDTSDDGNDGDGNQTDDPTEVPINQDPVLDVEKVIIQTAAAVGEEVIFEIRASNRGNVQLFNVAPSDTLTRDDGTVLSSDVTGPILTGNGNGDAILDPAETWTWTVTYTIVQADIDAGGISNVATVATTDVDDNPVVDVADDGNDADGNTVDDPTVLTFPPTPGLDVTKTVASVGTLAGEDVVFTIEAFNTGNVTLSGLSITDAMTNADGTVLAPVTITVTGLTAGALPPTETATYTVTYAMTQADIDSGEITNTATVSGTSPVGGTVTDVSDDGDDGDGNTTNDPTVAPIIQTPSAVATKEASVPRRLAGDLYEVVFTMTLENTGNVTLTNLVIEDDLAPFLVPATLVAVDTPVVSGFDVGTANAGYDGLVDIELTAAGGELAPNTIGTIELTVRYDVGAGFPTGTNTLEAISDELAAAVSASTGVIQGNAPDILASKTATPTTAQLGDTITYTLRFENRLDTIEADVSFLDTLPDGMVYTPNTAVADSGLTSEPTVAGNRLTWGLLDMAPGQVTTITYQARMVGGQAGDYVNTAIAVGADGQVLSNVATATVTRRAEAVFDCTDIIGKVFDDRNMNGYQDGLIDDAGISDQSYNGGKFQIAPALEPGGEPGLPNVRLSTPNGTLITTDEYGRYSVPCAALPQSIGSNFFLKLDTRTLPTGYFVTTENPRVVRTTPGTLSRLNFGATLGNLVEIDLTAAAFNAGQATPVPALADYVDQLIAQIRTTPSVVRLSYYRAGEDQAAANARLDVLERMIRDQWAGNGRYRLTIERIIRRTQ